MDCEVLCNGIKVVPRHFFSDYPCNNAGVVMLSGIKFSKFNTFLFTSVGFFFFQCYFHSELASRYYCPEEDRGLLHFTIFYCYQKFNVNSTIATYLVK